MSSNFWTSSHSLYHLLPRPVLSKARALDVKYATPKQLYCLGIWFANLIQKLGKRLLLRQVPIATATVFFKRFYLKNSYCETNPYLVLAACVFVAAKVEETPVHIKSVVSEAKLVFAEHNIKLFPAEPNKLGEMEFYLLEDLDFHLVVFHPYRSLLNMCGREPADAGRFPYSRVDEDAEIRKRETEARKKRDEELRKAARGAGPGGVGAGAGGEDGGVEEESEEERIRRLMGRGSGEGLMDIDEGVLQISLFLINDTYRTDVSLLYPPYVIALSALYIGFCLTAMNNPSSSSSSSTTTASSTAPSSRTRSSSTQTTNLATSTETNAALSLPPPPSGAADFLATFEVALPVLMGCVQEMVLLYPIWEAFEPSSGGGGGGGAGSARGMVSGGAGKAAADGKGGAGAGGGSGEGKEKFGPEEAEALVRRMIEERTVDIGHPENGGSPQVAGKKRQRA